MSNAEQPRLRNCSDLVFGNAKDVFFCRARLFFRCIAGVLYLKKAEGWRKKTPKQPKGLNANNFLEDSDKKALWRHCYKAVLMLVLCCPLLLHGQPADRDDCDEVLVFLQVEHLAVTEIPSLICAEGVFLPVSEIFGFLQIKTEYSSDFRGYTGFLPTPDQAFVINADQGKITYKGQEHPLPDSDLIRTPTETFLRARHFGDIFGLHADFDFRSLSVSISPDFELPVLREKRLSERRSGIGQQAASFKPDTIIDREKPLAHLSTADWALNLTRQSNGLDGARLQLALGGNLAGGEFSAMLNYNSALPFREKYQHYQWRHVNNNSKVLRQVRLGKIPVNSISTVLHPVLGAQVTNAPSYYRQSFGSYHLSERTEPGWTVELYVNNRLVDYTKADASGYFEFDVPLMYGSSEVRLRYYGPWGEENNSTRLFRVPFAFLPAGEVEYQASSGLVQDGMGSILSQGRVNYGLARQVTLGGGFEYLSTPGDVAQVLPFLTSAVNLAPGLMLNTEYVQGVRVKTMLNYYTPGKLRFQLNYKRYNQEQEAVRYNYDEERQVIVSMPYKIGGTRFFSRLAIGHNKLSTSDFTTAELNLTGSRAGLNVSFSSFALMREGGGIHGYGLLSVHLPPIDAWSFIPQLQYDYGYNDLRSLKMEVRKKVFGNGYLQASYEQQFIPSSYLLQLGFRYDFSMARAGAGLSQGRRFSSVHLMAMGSLIHEPGAEYTDFGRQTHVNLASVAFRPFLDVNNNGRRDSSEQAVEGLDVRINGGRKIYRPEDGSIIVTGLEPYRPHFVELDGIGFPHLAWSMENTRLQLYLTANKMKIIDVPVKVMGEASGTVFLEENGLKRGLGRVKLDFYNQDSVLVASQFTEGDGYFSYLGLAPGDYTLCVNREQMEGGRWRSTPSFMRFNIQASEEGDIVDTLDFVLSPKTAPPIGEADTQQVFADNVSPAPAERSLSQPQEVPAVDHTAPASKNPQQDLNDVPPTSAVQAVFRVQLMAGANRIDLDGTTFAGIEGVEEYKHQGLFKYIYGRESSLDAIVETRQEMQRRGFTGAFVVAYIDGVRVSIEEALNVQNAAALPAFEEVTFKVQVLAVAKPLPADHDLYSKASVKEYFHNGYYKYTLGESTSLGEAVLLQYQLRQKGYEAAFVVAFRNGQRISLAEALLRR